MRVKRKVLALILAMVLAFSSTCITGCRIDIGEISTAKEETPEVTTTEATTPAATTPEATTPGDTEPIEPMKVVMRDSLVATDAYIYALTNEGRVFMLPRAEEYKVYEELDAWTDIVDIAVVSDQSRSNMTTGEQAVIGLKGDGTITILNRTENISGRIDDVNTWTDIVSIEAGSTFVVGIKNDGSVVKAGNSEYALDALTDWTDIVQVSISDNSVVGLKADGTVVACGNNTYGQCEVSDWTNVVTVDMGDNHVVGLRSNGTVLASGVNVYGQCEVSEWADMVFVAAGVDYTIGIKKDGTMLAAGYNLDFRTKGIDKWSDMAYVTAGKDYELGITRSGKVMTAGCAMELSDVSGLSNIVVPYINVDMDFKQELPVVSSTIKELETEYWGDAVEFLPVKNGRIETEYININLSEEIAKYLCYNSNFGEDGTGGVGIYLESELFDIYDGKLHESGGYIAYYMRQTMSGAIIDMVVSAIPTKFVGDAKMRKDFNDNFSRVLEQLCKLRNIEYTYKDYELVREDGYAVYSDEMVEMFLNYMIDCEWNEEYAGEKIDFGEGYIWTVTFASDVQISRWENYTIYGLANDYICENCGNAEVVEIIKLAE